MNKLSAFCKLKSRTLNALEVFSLVWRQLTSYWNKDNLKQILGLPKLKTYGEHFNYNCM